MTAMAVIVFDPLARRKREQGWVGAVKHEPETGGLVVVGHVAPI